MRRYVAFLALAVVLAQTAGCGDKPAASSQAGKANGAASVVPPKPSSSPAAAQSESEKLTTVRAVLEKMAETYRSASSYEDFATAGYWEDGAEKPQRANFQVAFQRPNKLCMKFYQGELTCDGKKWFGFSKDIPDQAVLRDAPEKIKLPMLMADTALGKALNNGFFGGSPQLLLLLEEQPLEIMLAGIRDQDLTLEQPVRLGDYDCFRVRFRRAEGTGEYWIDQKTFVLRHMEFHAAPPPGSEGAVARRRRAYRGRFRARPAGRPDRSGGLQDRGARRRRVPSALMDAGPYQVIGKKLAPFQLADTRGKTWKSDSLMGKVTVLHLWQTDAPACPGVVPIIQAAYEKFKDNPRVAFWAINLDDTRVDSKTIEETARQWKLGLPLLRDPQWESPKSLKIAVAPATFFIDPQGVMQDCILGDLPVSTAATARKVEELLSGKDLSRAAVAEFHEQFKNYEEGVDKLFASDAQTTAMRRVEDTPAAKTAPTKLRLQPLWNCKWDLQRRPGNLLVVQDPAARPRIFVVDGVKSVSEISTDGKLLGTFAPKVADEEFFTCLRTAVGRDGKRFFAAFAPVQQRFHLFDEKFTYLLSFPADALTNRHTGLTDVALGDLDGDGVLKAYMGFVGTVGVKSASLQGKLIGSCRNVFNVGNVVPGPPDSQGRRELFCGNDANNIAILDAKLQPRGSARLPADGVLRGLMHADMSGNGSETWCGVVFLMDPQQTSGQFTALGLNESGNVQWRYTLPAGTPQVVEPIVVGRVLPGAASQWLLPGSDGSVQILSADGKLIDRFNYGANQRSGDRGD